MRCLIALALIFLVACSPVADVEPEEEVLVEENASAEQESIENLYDGLDEAMNELDLVE